MIVTGASEQVNTIEVWSNSKKLHWETFNAGSLESWPREWPQEWRSDGKGLEEKDGKLRGRSSAETNVLSLVQARVRTASRWWKCSRGSCTVSSLGASEWAPSVDCLRSSSYRGKFHDNSQSSLPQVRGRQHLSFSHVIGSPNFHSGNINLITCALTLS